MDQDRTQPESDEQASDADKAKAMEKAQREAAEERQEEGGYQ